MVDRLCSVLFGKSVVVARMSGGSFPPRSELCLLPLLPYLCVSLVLRPHHDCVVWEMTPCIRYEVFTLTEGVSVHATRYRFFCSAAAAAMASSGFSCHAMTTYAAMTTLAARTAPMALQHT